MMPFYGEPEEGKLSILGIVGAIFRSLFGSQASFVIEFLLVTACRSYYYDRRQSTAVMGERNLINPDPRNALFHT